MITLIESPLFWWGLILITIGLLARREHGLAREHNKAAADLWVAPIYPLDMARERRLHATPPGVKTPCVGVSRPIGDGRSIAAWEGASTGPQGDAA